MTLPGRRAVPLRLLRDRLARCRWSGLAALGVALVMGVLPTTDSPLTDFLERLELRTHDTRFADRGPRRSRSSAGIVLVALDDRTLEAWQDQPMAFWGARYAALVRQARHCGAAWIGFDVIPATRAEEALQMTVARAFERVRPGGRISDEDLDVLIASPEMTPDTQFREAVQNARGRVILADAVSKGGVLTGELRGLLAEEYIGLVDLPAQGDDAVRSAALYYRQGEEVLPSFPALLAARARDLDPRSGSALRGLARAEARDVPLATFWINYTGSGFRQIPANRLAAGQLEPAERRALQGAMVLVGPTHRDSDDVHRVPGGRYEAGVTIHAQALATLLDGSALRRATRSQEGLLTGAVLLLLVPPLVLLPFWWGLGVGAAAGGLWWWATCHTFAAGNYLLPVAGPLLGTAALFFVCHAVRSAEEGLARRRIERVFGRYVSPKIRDYLLEGSRNLQMGGLEGEASVLFFDIRDSTAHAEKRAPKVVMEERNALFRRIVPVIDRHGGLLYRYTGDGLLAVFGAPFPLDNHAQAACEAAVEIVQAVRKLNGPDGSGGAPLWRVGCAVHSGPLVYGNLGVADRSEFTVIGDTVNLAARLEGLNKQLGSEVVVSQATYNQLSAPPPARGPREKKVAGRQEPACIYVVHVAS